MRLEVSQKYVFSYAGIIRIRFTGQRSILRTLSRIVRPPEDSSYSLCGSIIVAKRSICVNPQMLQVFLELFENIQAIHTPPLPTFQYGDAGTSGSLHAGIDWSAPAPSLCRTPYLPQWDGSATQDAPGSDEYALFPA